MRIAAASAAASAGRAKLCDAVGTISVLGASRARLIRQLLTESLLLSAAGGGFGLILGSWTARGLAAVLEDIAARAAGGEFADAEHGRRHRPKITA